MIRNSLTRGLALLALVAVLVAAPVRADDELEQRASWTAPTAAEVKQHVDKWLAGQQLDEITQIKVQALWPAEGGPTDSRDLLDQVAATIALVDPETRPLVDLCRGERLDPTAPKFAVLNDEKQPDFVRNSLRLYYGRWLAQHDLYDEALDQLDGLQATDVIDPSALLFYQSVGYHRLLQKDPCLAALSQLLENEDSIPRRYATVAKLMEADFKPLKTGSLDEIARLMDDIKRRQNLYQSGKVVRKEEDDVVAKLEKLIEELEKQQGGGGGGGGAPGNTTRPSSPMQDSQPGGGTGAGDVEMKKIGKGIGWEYLPPKERAAAMAELAKDLPAHYREVIEEYFRKLARDEPK